ncbi:MAG: hypothetical protein FWG63_11510 [Defluviitaleaceae bacterium]|nr:hypothetical protein [Defluviitaleaceae bacterium]
MPYEQKIIKVKDIAEYPTELGNRCKLLKLNGLHPYQNTEEEIMHALETLAKDPKNLEICKGSSHCGAFWQFFEKGGTPFFEKDKIYIGEYNGKYWVSEGKHRSCMAMRTGVESITAEVYKQSSRNFLLPPVGNYGVYKFQFSYKQPNIIKGSAPVLWVRLPNYDGMTEINDTPTVFDSSFDTKGKIKEIMEGVFYKTSVFRKRFIFNPFKLEVTVSVEITIQKNHPKTKIWLLKSNLSSKQEVLSDMKTLYRHGCFREHHQDISINLKRKRR